MIGTTRVEAERLLDELLDAHLVQQQENGRYRFHDLLAEHAKAAVAPEERSEAIVRILDFYLHGATVADDLLSPGRPRVHTAVLHEPVDPPRFDTPVAALEWLEAERLNARAAVYLAAYQGHYRHAWQLPHHLAYFLLMRGYGRERVELHSVALAATHQLGDLKARAEALQGLGSAYLEDSNPRAEGYLHEALDLMRQIKDLRGEASTMGVLGTIACERRELDKAMKYFERGLTLMRQVGAKTGESNALHNIGVVYAERGEYGTALVHFEEALALQQKYGDARSCAMILHNIAQMHYHEFNDGVSLSFIERSLQVYRESGDWRGEMMAQADFGYMLYTMGELDRAHETVRAVITQTTTSMNLPDVESVLATMAEVRDHTGQISVLISLALEAELDGRLHEALRHAERCLVMVRRAARGWGEIRLLTRMSDLHLALGDTAAAIRLGEEAVRGAEEMCAPRAVAAAREILARATAPAAPAS